jgi:hypothetical protein
MMKKMKSELLLFSLYAGRWRVCFKVSEVAPFYLVFSKINQILHKKRKEAIQNAIQNKKEHQTPYLYS